MKMGYCQSTSGFNKYWRISLHLCALIIICFCFCTIGIYAANCNSNSDFPSETKFMFRKAATNYFQRNEVWETMAKGGVRGRRLLGGPGSSPPRCTWKCGNCTPCKAVHVVVPPGMRVTAEYYAEAWRCKCGNHLYMP